MRRLITVVVVLAVLVLGADRAAVWFAERAVASRLQSQGRLGRTPQVAIGGFPFLTQVAAGRYEHVQVDAADVPTPSGVTASAVHLDLRGVHARVADLLSGSAQDPTADDATGWARVSFAQLSAAITKAVTDSAAGQVLQSVRVGDAGDGRVRIAGTAQLAGLRAQASAVARVTLSDGRVRVRVAPSDLAGLDGLPAGVRGQVARLLDVTAEIPRLPYGITLTSLDVGPHGVTVSGRR